MIRKAYRTFIAASLGYIIAMVVIGPMISLGWIGEAFRALAQVIAWPFTTAFCYWAVFLTNFDGRTAEEKDEQKKADAKAERRARSGYRPPDQY